MFNHFQSEQQSLPFNNKKIIVVQNPYWIIAISIYQSFNIQIKRLSNKLQQLKMQRNVQIFADVAARVPSAALFNEIIQQQKHLYDIQPHKIERTQGQTMLNTYIKMAKRFNTSNQLNLDNNSWSQNERRVFVWFILCYTYFLQLDQKQFKDSIYEELSHVFFGKKPQFLHFQHLNLMKNKRRVNWTKQEDQILVKCIQQYTPGKWNQISKKIFYDSNRKFFRAPKQCRERWLNHLDKNKKHGDWKTQEDTIILEYVLQKGKRWSKIVPLLNETRTQHMIKNRYNSLIAKSKEGKKIKEEDVAKKILDSLTQVVYSQENNESKKQQVRAETVEGQKTLILGEQNTKVLQNLSNNISLPNSQTLSYNNPNQVGCSFYYKYLIYPQIFHNNTYNLYQLSKRKYQQMELSKNSSFSIYQPNISF